MNPALEARDLEVRKGSRKILDVPYLEIPTGQVVSILGPNGAGKSTLLKALSFLITLTRGEVFFLGKECTSAQCRLAARRNMATVFQDSLLLSGTVWFNVSTVLKLRGLPKNLVHQKTMFWLERMGVASLAHRNISSLSGGESQRVSLARAFVAEPKVLFLDEPFTSLDAPTRVMLMDELEGIIANTGVTTIFVTHDPEGIPFYADRVLVLEQGKISIDTTLTELMANPATPFLKAFFRHITQGKTYNLPSTV